MGIKMIDGISASGKSTLLHQIQKLDIEKNSKFSRLFVSEHLTERYFEEKRIEQKTVEQYLSNFLTWLSYPLELKNTSKFSKKEEVLTIYVERLFLTFLSRNLMSIDFLESQKALIQNLQLESILLLIPEENIEKRIHDSIKFRNIHWSNHIESLGGISKAAYIFMKQQSTMLELNNKLSKFMTIKNITINDLNNLPIQKIIS